MNFSSILFMRLSDAVATEDSVEPDYFKDLNLDQVVAAITRGHSEYHLTPFFNVPLHDVEAILYRQEIFRDLEEPELFNQVQLFAKKFRVMWQHLQQSDKRYYPYQKAAWFRDAVQMYCEAIHDLVIGMAQSHVVSRGLLAFRDYLTQYSQSESFTALRDDTIRLQSELQSVDYALHLKGQRIEVYPKAIEQDYSAEVEQTFHKFKRGAVKQYRSRFADRPDMNHVEAAILDLVARWYPEVFSHLQIYYETRRDYLDPKIGAFEREIQFYLAVIEYVDSLRTGGLTFCFPELSDTNQNIYAQTAFDVALAEKLRDEKATIVCNDFHYQDPERILVVSGPNQGGKTTFARMFGQLHYLSSMGCPVPGRAARLLVWDRLLTHFERQEDLQTLRGKLQDDLVRIHDILQVATDHSIIIMNEIFTSTTLQDAILLSRKVMEQILTIDALAICVTFIEELAALSEKTVSMVSTVDPNHPGTRTYKVLRQAQDGRSYAVSIAEKYHVTYDWVKERIQ